MRVLNQYQVLDDITILWFFLVLIGVAIIFTFAFDCNDGKGKIIGRMIGLCFVACAIIGFVLFTPMHEYQQVCFDESVGLNTIYENYNVIEQKGYLFTVEVTE